MKTALLLCFTSSLIVGAPVKLETLDQVALGPKSTYAFRYWMVVGDEKSIAARLDSLVAKYSGERASLSDLGTAIVPK